MLWVNHRLVVDTAPHWTAQFQSVSSGFQSICVGIGALFAGFGGLKIGEDWLMQKRIKRKIARLAQKYPIDSLNKEYRLVDTKSVPGKWWLLDITSNTKHWIRNLETTRDLGWSYSMVEHVEDKELEKYKTRETIDTRDL